MDKRKFAISEGAGVVAIYLAASFLHFTYALSGGGTLSAIFGAVNESVWEHVKIFSAAYSGYAAAQLMWLRVPFRKYITAKCAGLYFLMGSVIGFYYLYTSLTGGNILLADLISSAVFVALAQLISYRMTVTDKDTSELYYPALALIMLYYLMFFSFTVFPPRVGLFRDPVSGGYGLADAHPAGTHFS